MEGDAGANRGLDATDVEIVRQRLCTRPLHTTYGLLNAEIKARWRK
jgi:hypothetical protein